MAKNLRLADIYIKIYNKQPLMMEDLVFLAKYDRECFEKTCKNLLYNLPEAEEIMQPAGQMEQDGAKGQEESAPEAPVLQEEAPGIRALLDNLKRMEWEELKVQSLDADHVKSLLGSLYMELLFPHNDKCRYFQLEEQSDCSIFNRKA